MMMDPYLYLEEMNFENKSLSMQNYYIRKAKSEIVFYKKECRKKKDIVICPGPDVQLWWWKEVLSQMEMLHSIKLNSKKNLPNEGNN